MELLLEKRNYNKIELFKYLCQKNSGLTLYDMEIYLNLSRISIKRSLSELEKDLIKLPIQTLKIKHDDAKYFIKTEDKNLISHNIDSLKLFYLKQSVPFTTILLILQKPFFSIEDATSASLISPSYYYKIYKQLKPKLSNWGISISFSSEISNIKGSTFHIRYFLYYFYWTSFKNIEWPFLDTSQKFISNYLIFCDEIKKKTLNSSEETRLMLHLAIFFHEAIKNKHFVEIDYVTKQIITVFKDVSDLSEPIVQMLKHSTSTLLPSQLENELLYFNFIVRLTSTNLDSDSDKIAIGKELESLDFPIIRYSQFILNETIRYFNLECSHNTFYHLLYITIITFLSKDTMKINDDLFFKSPPIKNPSRRSRENSKELTLAIEKFIHRFHSNFCAEYPMPIYPKLSYNYIHHVILFLEKPSLSIFINYSKNIYSKSLIEKKLNHFFNDSSITIVKNINCADIILSDSFEITQKKEVALFFIDDVNEIEVWKNIVNYITVTLTHMHFHV